MVEPGENFAEDPDEQRRPLLPPEDRVWRHPSELGASRGASSEQVLVARRRWLASTPTRAGAGAAGIVGAILAAGVVLIGTHVGGWLEASHATSGRVLTSHPTIESLGPLTHSAKRIESRVARAVVTVRVSYGGASGTGSGVVVSPSGYVLVPASLVLSAAAISIVRSDGEEVAASLIGSDSATGLAVLKVAESGLPSLQFASRASSDATFDLLAWGPSMRDVGFTTMSADPPTVALGSGPPVLEQCAKANAPTGAVVVDADGDIAAVVTAQRNGEPLAAAGWVASFVTSQIIAHGRVDHGWLGIDGTNAQAAIPIEGAGPLASLASKASRPMVSAVRVTEVLPGSAAAAAGIEDGDDITGVDGQPVSSISVLQADLYMMPAFASVKLDVLQDGHFDQVQTRLEPAA